MEDGGEGGGVGAEERGGGRWAVDEKEGRDVNMAVTSLERGGCAG